MIDGTTKKFEKKERDSLHMEPFNFVLHTQCVTLNKIIRHRNTQKQIAYTTHTHTQTHDVNGKKRIHIKLVQSH